MIKATKKLHNNKKLRNKFLESFFSKTLKQFGVELNLLANEMYQYPAGLKGNFGRDSENDVFDLIERTYVGLFNNAIIRSFPDLATLQEFPVYNKNKSKGRADLLVVKNTNNGSVNILFEAKCGLLAYRHYEEVETKEYYEMMFRQVNGYYKAEKEYYIGKTYTVALGFDIILNKDLLKELVEENYKDKVTDYYYIFHTKEAGLAVSISIEGPWCI